VSELSDLYGRYKGLALAVGAGLILDEGADLAAETLRLAADAGRHRETDPSAAAQAAHRAALDLHRLATAKRSERAEAELIAQVRASHKALRSHLWDDIAHQYAPCGAHSHPHSHQEDHEHV
jgi:hypothetical protein